MPNRDYSEDAQGQPIDIETLAQGSNHEVELAGSKTVAPKSIEDTIDLEDEPEGQLTIDVYQTPEEIIVESALAGVTEDDLDINVTNDSVTIKGRRRRERQIKEEDYFYQECYWGRFSRSVILPQEIDAEKAYATLKNGILAVHLPKFSRQKAKKLKVKLE